MFEILTGGKHPLYTKEDDVESYKKKLKELD